MKKTHFWRRLLILLLALILAVILAFSSADNLKKAAFPTKYSEYVEYYAGKYSIDPLLLYAIIRTESGFSSDAVSEVDARGLMQITEVTYQWIKGRIAPTEEMSFDSLYDPEVNIRFGSNYWACCLERYGNDIATAAAAYFSGWGTVDELLKKDEYSKDGKTLEVFPYEGMSQYVQKIKRNYSMYQKIYESEE